MPVFRLSKAAASATAKNTGFAMFAAKQSALAPAASSEGSADTGLEPHEKLQQADASATVMGTGVDSDNQLSAMD